MSTPLWHVLPLATPTARCRIIDHTPSITVICGSSVGEPHVQLPHLLGLCLGDSPAVDLASVDLEVYLGPEDGGKLLLLTGALHAQEVLLPKVVPE